MAQPGMKPRWLLNAALKLPNEISEDTEVSNIQMMKGSSKNKIMPLMRCMPETSAANGQR